MSGSRLVTTAEHNAFLLKRADPVTHLTPQKCAVPSGVKSHAPRSASVTMTCIFSEQNSEVLESPEFRDELRWGFRKQGDKGEECCVETVG